MVLKGVFFRRSILNGLERTIMVLKWLDFDAMTHGGTHWGWSWKKLPCTKWWITLPKIVGLGCNFDTIWGPIGVTSDVNLNCLPILLLELSWFECVFNTLPNLLTRGTIGTFDTMEFENLKFGMFWLVWLGYAEMAPKMLDLYTKIHRNAMVLKGIKWSWKNHICPLLWPYCLYN